MRLRDVLASIWCLSVLASTNSSTTLPPAPSSPLPPSSLSLMGAAQRCDLEGVERALREDGVNVSAVVDDDGRTPLDGALMAPCADEDVAVSHVRRHLISLTQTAPRSECRHQPPAARRAGPPTQIFAIVQRLYKHPSCGLACVSGSSTRDGITPLHRVVLRWASSFFPSRCDCTRVCVWGVGWGDAQNMPTRWRPSQSTPHRPPLSHHTTDRPDPLNTSAQYRSKPLGLRHQPAPASVP